MSFAPAYAYQALNRINEDDIKTAETLLETMKIPASKLAEENTKWCVENKPSLVAALFKQVSPNKIDEILQSLNPLLLSTAKTDNKNQENLISNLLKKLTDEEKTQLRQMLEFINDNTSALQTIFNTQQHPAVDKLRRRASLAKEGISEFFGSLSPKKKRRSFDETTTPKKEVLPKEFLTTTMTILRKIYQTLQENPEAMLEKASRPQTR